jgi:5-oxoprolinase (ATP-hydrolysing) subunit B
MEVRATWLADDVLWLDGVPRGASGSLRRFPGVADVSEAWGRTAIYLAPEASSSTFDWRALVAGMETAEYAIPPCQTVAVDWSQGLDWEVVQAHCGLGQEELIQWLEGADLTVEAIGFQPGFPYCSGLPLPLCGLARRVPPRNRVPKGAVAIAEDMLGIYPDASPGGWHVLGVTEFSLFEEGRATLVAGQTIRLVSR